jgi:PAS domain S-box-containing protein
MQIRTRLKINIFLFIFLLIFIIANYFYISVATKNDFKLSLFTSRLLEDFAKVRLYSFNYFLEPGQGNLEVWKTQYQKIFDFINIDFPETRSQKETLTRMNSDLLKIQNTFFKIQKTVEREVKYSLNKNEKTVMINKELISDFIRESQTFLDNAFILQRAAQKNVLNAQKNPYYFLIFLAIVIGIIMAGDLIFISRKIIESIFQFTLGTQLIAKGNLDYRFSTKNEDEFGRLGASINVMNENLKRSYLKINRLNRIYFLLSQVNQAIIASLNKNLLFHKICDIAVQYGSFEMAWIGMTNVETKSVIPVACNGAEESYVKKIKISIDGSKPEGNGPTGTAIREQRSVVCNDFQNSESTLFWRKDQALKSFSSSAAIPIFEKKKIVGSMNVYSKEKDFFNKEEIVLLEEIASNISFALDKIEQEKLREKAETALKESEEKYRLLIENSHDLICELNDSGYYIYLNSNYEKILGYSSDELLGCHVMSFLHPDDAEKMNQEFINIFSVGKTSLEIRLRHKSGEWIWMESVGTLFRTFHGDLRVVILSRDVTERKNIERVLRESEEKYRLLYTSMSEGVALHEVITNDTGAPIDYRFLDVNQNFEVLTGLTRSQLIGRTVLQVMPNHELYFIPEYGEVALSGNPQHFENYSRLANKYYEIFAYSPKKGQFAALITDITERKIAEEQIKSSLQEKEILLKEIHHRVKNNLQIISSLLQLQEKYFKNEEYVSVFRESQNRVKTMAMIHEKLYQSKNLAEVDFHDYIDNLSHSLFASYRVSPSQVELSLKLERIPLNINTAIPCGLLINELISNIFKHAFPASRKGKITVEMKRLPGSLIYLKIRDNGVGLPKNFNVEKCESLGLKLVRTLAMQLDGKLSIKSSKGAEFSIEFPDKVR